MGNKVVKLKAIEIVILYFKNTKSVIHENCVSNEKYIFENGSYVIVGRYFDTGDGWLEFDGERFSLTKVELMLMREVISLSYNKILYF